MELDIEGIIQRAVQEAVAGVIKPTKRQQTDQEKIEEYSRQTRLKYAKKNSNEK